MSAPYRSYLLRLWLEPNDPPVWRAILESPVNGERHGFANLERLFAFLEQETERMGQDEGLTQNPNGKYSKCPIYRDK
jgi:hypothetical protein